MVAVRVTISLRSRLRACSGCLRAKASMRWVSCAPRAAASSIGLHDRRELPALPASSCDSISVMPMMTVRMLLKSCATPPVSWPTASIFCAWRSWLSSMMRSLMSRPMKKYCRSGSDQIPVQASGTSVAVPVDVAAFEIAREPAAARVPHFVARALQVVGVNEILCAAADHLVRRCSRGSRASSG